MINFNHVYRPSSDLKSKSKAELVALHRKAVSNFYASKQAGEWAAVVFGAVVIIQMTYSFDNAGWYGRILSALTILTWFCWAYIFSPARQEKELLDIEAEIAFNDRFHLDTLAPGVQLGHEPEA